MTQVLIVIIVLIVLGGVSELIGGGIAYCIKACGIESDFDVWSGLVWLLLMAAVGLLLWGTSWSWLSYVLLALGGFVAVVWVVAVFCVGLDLLRLNANPIAARVRQYKNALVGRMREYLNERRAGWSLDDRELLKQEILKIVEYSDKKISRLWRIDHKLRPVSDGFRHRLIADLGLPPNATYTELFMMVRFDFDWSRAPAYLHKRKLNVEEEEELIRGRSEWDPDFWEVRASPAVIGKVLTTAELEAYLNKQERELEELKRQLDAKELKIRTDQFIEGLLRRDVEFERSQNTVIAGLEKILKELDAEGLALISKAREFEATLGDKNYLFEQREADCRTAEEQLKKAQQQAIWRQKQLLEAHLGYTLSKITQDQLRQAEEECTRALADVRDCQESLRRANQARQEQGWDRGAWRDARAKVNGLLADLRQRSNESSRAVADLMREFNDRAPVRRRVEAILDEAMAQGLDVTRISEFLADNKLYHLTDSDDHPDKKAMEKRAERAFSRAVDWDARLRSEGVRDPAQDKNGESQVYRRPGWITVDVSTDSLNKQEPYEY